LFLLNLALATDVLSVAHCHCLLFPNALEEQGGDVGICIHRSLIFLSMHGA